MRAAALTLLAALTACGESLEPERSLRLALDVGGLPDGAAAPYRVFVSDSIAIAHGDISSGESDTVRISSSDAVSLEWQDAVATLGEADFVFAPAERLVVVEDSERDTTVALNGSYALASGGFVLTGSGIPVEAPARWRVVNGSDSVLAHGTLRSGEVLRRGDIPVGAAQLQLDTVFLDLGDIRHAYAPPERVIPLSVGASLDLTSIDAPYTIVSAVVQLSESGLPDGAQAGWTLTRTDGSSSIGGSVLADSLAIAFLIEPGDYTLQWAEVTVGGTTYLPDPASALVTLEPRIEPHVLSAVYQAQP